jgi:ATP-dependent exoDNAse (exonuclease V) beta subunit
LEHAPLTYSAKLAESIFREDYLEEHLKAYIDNLNLLYVAMTRAKKELYLRPYAPYKKKDGSISLNDMSSTIWYVLMALREEWQENSRFTIGVKQMIPEQNFSHSDTLSLNHYPTWNPQDRVQVKYRHKDYLDSEEDGLSAIDEGKLLHEIFKSIRTQEEVEQAVQQAYLNGMILREEKENMCAKIEGYLKNSGAESWFSPECNVLNEKDILFPSGQKVRPDRVIILPDGRLQVIDYKFGQNEESKYLKQVAFYCTTLKKMGYSIVEGFVWYVKLGKIVAVSFK